MNREMVLTKDAEFDQINQLYDECLIYLKTVKDRNKIYSVDTAVDTALICENNHEESIELEETSKLCDRNNNADDDEISIIKSDESETRSSEELQDPTYEVIDVPDNDEPSEIPTIGFKVESERKTSETSQAKEVISQRLRRLSYQLPKIVITQSNTSLNMDDSRPPKIDGYYKMEPRRKPSVVVNINLKNTPFRKRVPYGEFPKRLVSKTGVENVALISNVPYERIRLLNDTFHTLINLRWRWIVIGTMVVHFAIWLVFAVFWYITAFAHYDFEPDPPKRTCVTGGKDFVTIFLASVEAQTTIGFGDRAIDEECPESIFLFVMQLILGTGLSGVLTCVVYAKLTRPEKQSRDGVGFSKKAVISMRDGRLCLMLRAWDLHHDHIIGSEFCAHFVNTYKTKENEIIRFFARPLLLQQGQFLLWPVTLVHIIDEESPLYKYTPNLFANSRYEITVSLKGASASMGTFTQSQTSYMPTEVLWGHRFPPVVTYDSRKQKYVIDHKKLNVTEPVDTPHCSAYEIYGTKTEEEPIPMPPPSPSSFSEKISAFVLERTSSFRKKENK